MRIVAAALALGVGLLPVSCGDSGDPHRAEGRKPVSAPEVAPFEDSGPPRTPAERRRRAALRRDQRPVVAALRGGDPIADVERAVTHEARARRRRGELRAHVRETECGPPATLADGAIATECIGETSRGAGVVVGVPFVALVEPALGRITFCKRNVGAGEGSSLTGVRVALPKPCRRALHRR